MRSVGHKKPNRNTQDRVYESLLPLKSGKFIWCVGFMIVHPFIQSQNHLDLKRS